MNRHSWISTTIGDDRTATCERCGLLRERRTTRLRMAITTAPPYDHYQYQSRMAYSHNGNSWTFTRPECKP